LKFVPCELLAGAQYRPTSVPLHIKVPVLNMHAVT